MFDRRTTIRYIALLAFMGVGSALDVACLGLIPAYIRLVAHAGDPASLPFVADTLATLSPRRILLLGAAIVVLCFLVKNLFMFLLARFQYTTAERHRLRIAVRLFRAYMQAPLPFHLQRRSSEVLRNAQSECVEIVRGVILPLLGIVLSGLITLFVAGLLVAATPLVGLAAVAAVGASSWAISGSLRSRTRQYGQQAKRERARVLQALSEGLGAFVDARIYGCEETLVQRFAQRLRVLTRAERSRQILTRAIPLLVESASVVVLVAVPLVLLWDGASPTEVLPTIALVGACAVRLRQSMGSVVANLNQIQFSAPSIANVVADLELLESVSGRASGAKPTCPPLSYETALTVEKVSFTYEGATAPALHEVSLTIPRGAFLGLAGRTGCGKTTLLHILLGLLAPSAGRVTVDGVDIAANPHGWMANLGYVPQSGFLLDATIRQNIALHARGAPLHDAALERAVRAAQLVEVIEALPHGLDTPVGERGARLSGGQRQRIGLARALYHASTCLVLDEATSALDAATESRVLESVRREYPRATILMVTHRLSSLAACDRVCVMDDGYLVAQGPYGDLLQTSAAFSRLGAETPKDTGVGTEIA